MGKKKMIVKELPAGVLPGGLVDLMEEAANAASFGMPVREIAGQIRSALVALPADFDWSAAWNAWVGLEAVVDSGLAYHRLETLPRAMAAIYWHAGRR